MKKFLQILTKFLIILFGLISFALLIIVLFRPEWMKMAIEWVGELIKELGDWNYVIAFSSALIESLPVIGSLVPGMNVMVLIGGFWGKIHLLETIIFASAGAMLGNYFGYWIGKKYGKHIIENYGDYVGVGRTEQKILEKQLEKNGFWYIVLGKFHGTLRAFIPFIAGAGQMAEKNFWLYNSVGSIIWATTINLLGVFFVDQYEIILDHFGKISTAVLVLIIAYFWFFKRDAMKQYWNDKNNEINEKIAQSEKNSTKTEKIPQKMKKNIWETTYENISIRVENSWSWNGFTEEKIFINEKIFHEYSGEIQWTGGLHKDFEYENHKITVKIGTKWTMFDTACQILVDDVLIFGDKIIFFAGKK